MTAFSNAQTARLRWHCRRGMRELDVLLMKYLDQVFPQAGSAAQAAFAALLELQDPELLALLTGKLTCERKDMADVIDQLTRLGG